MERRGREGGEGREGGRERERERERVREIDVYMHQKCREKFLS